MEIDDTIYRLSGYREDFYLALAKFDDGARFFVTCEGDVDMIHEYPELIEGVYQLEMDHFSKIREPFKRSEEYFVKPTDSKEKVKLTFFYIDGMDVDELG